MGHKDNKDRALSSPAAENGWLAFRGEDLDNRARVASRRCAYSAAAVMICGVLVFAGARLYRYYLSEDAPDHLDRSASEQEVGLKLGLSYKGVSLDRDVTITVKPQKVSYDKAQELFDGCEEWLKEQLSSGPVFPKEAPNGVAITWQDEDLSYLGEEQAGEVLLIAQLSAGEYFRVSAFTVPLDPSKEDYEESLGKLAEKIEDELSMGNDGSRIVLPKSREGADLRWSLPEDQFPLLVLLACVFAAAFIWLSRRDGLKRSLKKRREEFEAEIPNMSFQMILLLNAGLVVESAFTELLRQNRDSASPLYRIFRDISDRAALRNVSFVSELYAFSQGSRSADLIRFSTLVYEHTSRGASLADKLQQERDIMWQSRVNLAKTKVRQAETKLCFPLVLLLLSLIIITAVPSFLGM